MLDGSRLKIGVAKSGPKDNKQYATKKNFNKAKEHFQINIYSNRFKAWVVNNKSQERWQIIIRPSMFLKIEKSVVSL
ncbi:hypothetical protein SAMN06298216_3837 [Spirosomataceae bacterium TFI 002]|nr:hypothetical protein SAMN06298216_3837 [Spirosomataceae bacterium TFI 002]